MKQFHLLAFTAALLLTGCASDETLDVSPEAGVPMRFMISADDVATRFDPWTYNELLEGFTIKISTATKTLYQGSVIYNGDEDKWELDTSATIYWPADETEKVRFDAISDWLYQATTVDLADFEAADLLVCHMSKSLSDYPSGIINLQFTHLLSAASFSVTLEDDATIQDAHLMNLSIKRNTGQQYNYTTDSWNTDSDESIYFDCDQTPGAAAAHVTVTKTESVAVNPFRYALGGNVAPYLFIPGSYTATAEYWVYNTDGSTTTIDAPKTSTATFTLSAGQIHNINLTLTK